jgi:hypothetical protein
MNNPLRVGRQFAPVAQPQPLVFTGLVLAESWADPKPIPMSAEVCALASAAQRTSRETGAM